MKDRVTIKGIDCFGVWDEYSNVYMVGDYANGMELDDVWCPPVGMKNWTEAVNHLKVWADDNNIELYELTVV